MVNSHAALSIAPLECLDREPGGFAIAALRNLTLVHWMGPSQLDYVHRIDAANKQVVARFPDGFSNIQVVEDGLPLPEADVRNAFGKMLREHDGRNLACVGILLLGAGFWASAVQGLVTGITMLVKPRCAFQFAREAAQLSTWVAHEHTRRTGVPLGAGEVLAALQALRSGSLEQPKAG